MPKLPSLPPWLQWVSLATVFVLLVFSCGKNNSSNSSSVHGGDEPLANKINNYLGTTDAEDPDKWTGLTGNLKQHARDVKKALDDLNCRVYMLENKITNRPAECPPGGGGTVPKDPPGYP